MSIAPPKLLAGAALLYWGYLTGHIAAALPAAILLESNSWLNLRWDLTRKSYIRAWHFCLVCGVFIAAIAWLNGMTAWNAHTIFVWAPFIMMPMELAQRFGNADKIPLNSFSFFAHRKMLQDIEEGRDISPRMINTSYPYIAIVLLATAKASQNELYHFIGLSLLIGACFYGSMRKNGYRPWAWTSALLLVIIFAHISQWGMYKLRRYYRGGENITINQHPSANEAKTSIGRLGRIKSSPHIFWRMQVNGGRIPKLLSSAVYNHYSGAIWSHEYRDSQESQYDESGYRGYQSAAASKPEDRDIRWFTEKPPTLTETAPIAIIGEVDAKRKEHPLPLPHRFLAIGDLDAEAFIECNRLGTVRMANPNYNVVEYAIWPGDFSTTEEPPEQRRDPRINLDLAIPSEERAALKRVCQQLDLYNPALTTAAKIQKIRRFFSDEFKYSTHLTTPRFDRGKRDASISLFLEESRTGHCEYFATATTLLLREAGIPARYCIGFAVSERNATREEWVMRGQHAHAWSRAWIEQNNSKGELVGYWENVDLTPPSWQSMDLGNTDSWNQQIADWSQRLSEDFLIWRTREANKNRVYVAIGAIITLMALWILWRLWQTRQRHIHSKAHYYQRPQDSPHTALHKLEHLAAKKIGPRPVGTPLCQWLQGILFLDQPSQNELRTLLASAIALHSAIRFDPVGAAPSEHQKLNELCASLKPAIKNLPS